MANHDDKNGDKIFFAGFVSICLHGNKTGNKFCIGSSTDLYVVSKSIEIIEIVDTYRFVVLDLITAQQL